jgi:hypothetical protein
MADQPTLEPNVTLAESSDRTVHVALKSALPLTLHPDQYWRTDGNSPVRITKDGATAFFSSYAPVGHTLRRHGGTDLRFAEEPVPVKFLGDPDPHIGKWIEAIWQDPAGRLIGWYHGEQLAPRSSKLFVPHIGTAVSEDDGFTWQCCEKVLAADATGVDCSWQNGFIAGGFGDFCVVPDRTAQNLYMFFTSYHPDERAQGVAVAHLPAGSAAHAADMVWWSVGGWQPLGVGLPKPLWPVRRGWRHADPDSFWGPAVHFNRSLDAYVMLLNRTAGGACDLVQEGVYVSLNPRLEEPEGWSPPIQLVRGGAWYPEVVGLAEGDGDTLAGATARFYMAGFSAWEIEFSRPERCGIRRPLWPTRSDFARAFGATRRCPW